jgi:hypothetical protein
MTSEVAKRVLMMLVSSCGELRIGGEGEANEEGEERVTGGGVLGKGGPKGGRGEAGGAGGRSPASGSMARATTRTAAEAIDEQSGASLVSSREPASAPWSLRMYIWARHPDSAWVT